jgi:hypothetical protein
MSNKSVATMGIDIGKNSFHVVGLDERGAIVLHPGVYVCAGDHGVSLPEKFGASRSPMPFSTWQNDFYHTTVEIAQFG